MRKRQKERQNKKFSLVKMSTGKQCCDVYIVKKKINSRTYRKKDDDTVHDTYLNLKDLLKTERNFLSELRYIVFIITTADTNLYTLNVLWKQSSDSPST